MASQLETLLQETLSDLGTLSPEKIGALVQEALKTFASLQEMGKSADPAERAEASKMADSLKAMVMAQTEALGQLTPDKLSALAEKGQGVFSEGTLNELGAAREKLAGFQESLGPRSSPAKRRRGNVIQFPV